MIEYLQGNGGYLISHEIFLYVFDTILMAVVMLIFLVWYVEDLESKKETAARVKRSDEHSLRTWEALTGSSGGKQSADV